ncbi:MAG: hypothetical protein HQ547_00925, partial [Candidatus Omnitrophica bacterium]|nr:hypothetical protein [Candidatus Omnitrophota bacterium]
MLVNRDISVNKGCGWVKENICGCVGKSRKWQYTDQRSLYTQLLKDNVLSYPIDNFGRFNQDSRMVIFSIALALYDAGGHYVRGEKQDVGIVGTSPDGALTTNLSYFQDYVKAGRKLGRGNFFIYTLPSSPLAEAAIHFGLCGPLAYIGYAKEPEENLLVHAQYMIKNKNAI